MKNQPAAPIAALLLIVCAATAVAADQQPAPAPTPGAIDETIDAGEAENKAPARALVHWNEYEGPHFSIRGGFGFLYDYAAFDHLHDAPRCPSCDAVIRPEVVLFGEMLPGPEIERLQTEMRRGFDAVISIGTTAVFPYISGPIVHTRHAGGLTIEINPGISEISDIVHFHLRTGAAAAMQALCAALDRSAQ